MTENTQEITPLTFEEIVNGVDAINIQAAGKEIIDWLAENVQDYVDNSKTFYRQYFEAPQLEKMANLKKLSELFNRIPVDDSTEEAAQVALNEIIMAEHEGRSEEEIDQISSDLEGKEKTETQIEQSKAMDLLRGVEAQIKLAIIENKEGMDKLYKALIYYYEMVGFSSEKGPILQEWDGNIELKDFLYDPISMTVSVTKKYHKQTKDGNIIEGAEVPASELVKEVHVPEAFVVEFFVRKWPRKPGASMY